MDFKILELSDVLFVNFNFFSFFGLSKYSLEDSSWCHLVVCNLLYNEINEFDQINSYFSSQWKQTSAVR